MTRMRENPCKPDEQYDLIERCSWGPRLELFARGARPGWTVWGNEADASYRPSWDTYANHSGVDRPGAQVVPLKSRRR